MSELTAEVGSTTNSYEVLAKLATGGMAEIFLARASAAGVDRYVVLKRVLHQRAQDLHFIQMFLDEARLAAQLQHANIAQVHDIGKLGDSFFFTMEYVHGETVGALIRKAQSGKPIPISTVLTIVAGASAGLHHAHERVGIDGVPLGIVHRDVSPSNLMISYEGTVKLVDFGVAKATQRVAETQSGTVKGKISYLSPEQCRGKEVDRRSDLFSLGIVMWELLTGERLFKRGSDYEQMEAIVLEPTSSPSSRRADVPPEVDAIVDKLLSKSPDARYQSADELHEAIEAAAVKIGSTLSTASLSRFLRETFGRRPEPWVEIRREHPDGLTVVTEPVPEHIEIPIADSVSRDLASLPTSPSDVKASGSRPPVKPSSEVSTGVRTSQKLRLAAARDRSARRSWPGDAFMDYSAMRDKLPAAPRRRWGLALLVLGLLGAAAVAIVFFLDPWGGDADRKAEAPKLAVTPATDARVAEVADAPEPVASAAPDAALAPVDAPPVAVGRPPPVEKKPPEILPIGQYRGPLRRSRPARRIGRLQETLGRRRTRSLPRTIERRPHRHVRRRALGGSRASRRLTKRP